mmetsp:Transcript_33430/g.76372  ORF Transcript_33430/g.76372 Transcript_33430/m.76372 type:complete len:266 (+) Transcript_33430:1461-2258(+)
MSKATRKRRWVCLCRSSTTERKMISRPPSAASWRTLSLPWWRQPTPCCLSPRSSSGTKTARRCTGGVPRASFPPPRAQTPRAGRGAAPPSRQTHRLTPPARRSRRPSRSASASPSTRSTRPPSPALRHPSRRRRRPCRAPALQPAGPQPSHSWGALNSLARPCSQRLQATLRLATSSATRLRLATPPRLALLRPAPRSLRPPRRLAPPARLSVWSSPLCRPWPVSSKRLHPRRRPLWPRLAAHPPPCHRARPPALRKTSTCSSEG